MLNKRDAVAGLALVACLAAGCSSSPGAVVSRLHSDTRKSAGAILTDSGLPLGQNFIVQAGELCVTSGTVRVTGVNAVVTQGKLRVNEWGLRYQRKHDMGGLHDPNGARNTTLAELGGFTHKPVSTLCNSNAYTELNISMLPQTPATTVKDFIVHTAGEGTVTVYLGSGTCTVYVTNGSNRCPA